jgi:hypothetical protein
MPYNADAWAKMSSKLDAKATSGSEGAATAAGSVGVVEAIRQSLENAEMPYNPSAWDAMKSKLDATKPVAQTGGSNLKWFVAASVVTGIVVASYFIFSNDTNKSQLDENQLAQTETTTSGTSSDVNNESTTATDGATTVDTQTESAASAEGSQTDPSAASSNGESSNTGASSNENVSSNTMNSGGQQSTSNSNGNSGQNNRTTPPTPPLPSTVLMVPAISDMCQGVPFTVENTNDVPLLVLGPDLYFIVPANDSRKIRTKKSGVHSIGALETESTTPRKEFMIKDSPAADFLIDPSTKFENGLPTTKVESTVTGTNFEWVFSNQRSNGQEADAHFYTKGNHDITLTVTGSNGCKTSVTKPIFVEDNYNLMAMNSFRPNSTDPTTNTFMPYALKERDVRFTMIIIDPRDGHVIFETSDASNAWDGTDAKTGRTVPFETSYIWKVTIENTEINEARNEYTGHVIPVHSSN